MTTASIMNDLLIYFGLVMGAGLAAPLLVTLGARWLS